MAKLTKAKKRITPRDWKKWFLVQDQKIKQAQADQVKAELSLINLKQIPRQHRCSFANLARRLKSSEIILKLYSSDSIKDAKLLSDEELALYSLALARLGAFNEANRLMAKVKGNEKALSHLRGACLLTQWEYKKAETIYKNLLKDKTLSTYEILIGRINLASCLIFLGKFAAALKLLQSFLPYQKEFSLLFGNSLELSAQAYLGLKEFKRAELSATAALEILKSGGGRYSLYAKKWILIAKGFQSHQKLEDWDDLKNECLKLNDFETVRELDLFRAILEKDKMLLFKVYFCTPFSSYRKKALQRYGSVVKIPNEFILNPISNRQIIDLVSGTINIENTIEKLSQTHLTLMRALCRDLYKPTTEGELFNELYPQQNFDIFSSPHRVFQLVQTLRQFLLAQKVKLKILHANNCYFIDYQDVSINVGLNYDQISTEDSLQAKFEMWINSLESPILRRGDIESHFKIGKDKSLALIKIGITKKLLKKNGDGNNVTYRTLKKNVSK